ncbi:MAG: histidine--tRNA ligase family protein [Chloroflexi bacterium]|nr:histidine--tRNA ligase family protein [Chloroflexota bacterium]
MSLRDYSPARWRRLVTIRERLERFLDRRGYQTVTTPILESTDLFLRKSGGELAARMYSFVDPSGRRVSLRPEFTSSVVQGIVDGALKGPMPQRWQYCGPVFRYEGEAADGSGGGSEFQQLGAELVGAGGAVADAEVIALAAQGLTALGVKGHRLRIGHIGVVNALLDALGLSERARVFVLGSFEELASGPQGLDAVRARALEMGLLPSEGNRRITQLARRMAPEDAEDMVEGFLGQGIDGITGQRTPEEIFRRYLKKLREAGVPEIVERSLRFSQELVALSGPAGRVLPKLRKLLDRYGLDAGLLAPVDDLLAALAPYDLKGVPVVLDFGMARGIAYYTGVVFDIEHTRVKSAPWLGGGGRYDGLVTALGGRRDVPALGFAYAVERIADLLPAGFGADEMGGQQRVLVVQQEGSAEQAVALAERLRAQGIPAELELSGRSDAEVAKLAQARGIQTVMRVGQDGKVAEKNV